MGGKVTTAIWTALHQLQDAYVSALDNDQLEKWPDFFTEDCLYEIVPKENADMGLPVGLIHCYNKKMLRDRVVSLRHANVFEAHTYRHMVSGLSLDVIDKETVDAVSNYVVIQTRTNGESQVFQAGRYLDRAVRTPDGWLYSSKKVIYDTSRVQTLLATPI